MDDQVLQQFISTFMFLQRFNCLEAIDEMFLKLIKADWSTESFATNKLLIVTFCRTNARFRNQLKNYQPFLDKSIKYLQDNNFDPNKVLKGII